MLKLNETSEKRPGARNCVNRRNPRRNRCASRLKKNGRYGRLKDRKKKKREPEGKRLTINEGLNVSGCARNSGNESDKKDTNGEDATTEIGVVTKTAAALESENAIVFGIVPQPIALIVACPRIIETRNVKNLLHRKTQPLHPSLLWMTSH